MGQIERDLGEYIEIQGNYGLFDQIKANKRNIFFSILNPILFILLAVLFSFAIMNSDSAAAPKTILGYSAMTVLTHSMDDVYPQHSLLIVKRLDPLTIQIGDDITFLRQDNASATHRVVDIYEDYNNWGMRGFQTQGTNNPTPDVEIVAAKNIVGRVIFHIPQVGLIIKTIRENLIMSAIMMVLFIVFLNILGRVIRTLKE